MIVKDSENGLIIKVKIVPNSSKNELLVEDEMLKVRVTAQPIENKANKALVEFLSKKFKIAKTNIKIVRGETSREKTLCLSILDSEKKKSIISELTK